MNLTELYCKIGQMCYDRKGNLLITVGVWTYEKELINYYNAYCHDALGMQ